MTRRFTGTVVALLALLAVAGCSGAGDGSDAAAPAADAGAVAPAEALDEAGWADEVCGAIVDVESVPQPDTFPTDPREALTVLDEYLGSYVTTLGASIDRLEGAGASPVEGGDQFVDGIVDNLTQIRTAVEEARTQLGGIDVTNPDSVLSTFPGIQENLVAAANDLPDPTAGLQDLGALEAAGADAPNCRQLVSGTS